MIAVCTAACLVPVRSITRKSTGDKFSYGAAENGPGPCTKILSMKLDGIMRGKLPDQFGWRSLVSVADDKEELESEMESEMKPEQEKKLEPETKQLEPEKKLEPEMKPEPTETETKYERLSYSGSLSALLGFGCDHARLTCQ